MANLTTHVWQLSSGTWWTNPRFLRIKECQIKTNAPSRKLRPSSTKCNCRDFFYRIVTVTFWLHLLSRLFFFPWNDAQDRLAAGDVNECGHKSTTTVAFSSFFSNKFVGPSWPIQSNTGNRKKHMPLTNIAVSIMTFRRNHYQTDEKYIVFVWSCRQGKCQRTNVW